MCFGDCKCSLQSHIIIKAIKSIQRILAGYSVCTVIISHDKIGKSL